VARDQANVLEELKSSKPGSLQWKTALDWANEVTLKDLRLFYGDESKHEDAVAIIDNRLGFMHRKKTGAIPLPSPARKEESGRGKRKKKDDGEGKAAEKPRTGPGHPQRTLQPPQKKQWSNQPKKQKQKPEPEPEPKKSNTPPGHKLGIDMKDVAWFDNLVDAKVLVETYPDMDLIDPPQCYMCKYIYDFLVEKKPIPPDKFGEGSICSVKNCVWHWNVCFCVKHPELKLQAIAL